MLRQQTKDYDDYEKKMKRRADILYDHTDNDIGMNDKQTEKTDFPELKQEKTISEPVQENETESEYKSRYDRTPEEDEEILDEFYPSMKDSSKETIDKGELTGGAASIGNNKDLLSQLGINQDDETNSNLDYKIENNTISVSNKPSEYEIINNVKYPRFTDNKRIEALKQAAKEERSQRLRENNTQYLKHHAKLEQIGLDYVDNDIVKQIGKKMKRVADEAVENLHMSRTDSYMNTDYAKKHKVYNNYKESPANLVNYFKQKISEQIGEQRLETTKGVFIDADSKSSASLKNELTNDVDFIEKLKKYNTAMQKGYAINDSIEFKGKNWHNALGNADIRDMHIDRSGNIELYITDVYDFNEGENTSNLVKVGRDRQDKGEITPYFIAYRVIITKDEAEQLLSNKNNHGADNKQ